ncbi:isoprenylcysteine carboxylmethyltransferase family protein [Vineibacter terrae]|uniref:methyltransferase family protein n=1 Tax=Vineibacter terrae TaxID=2586908 RepID=UPI002E2F39DE|nr:isoprenylcysteine carboxylmethyltransferase family protein [Vineibacter terrae]HEX2889440.1 isoprenylcysteine carboxylmethyltransferase family protein [Vineibacter terrae]
MTTVSLFRLAWGLWLLSWLLATPWSAPTLKRVVSGATTLVRLVILAGVVLLLGGVSWLDVRHLWHVGSQGVWLLAALAVASFLFAWWARVHLGRLWSGAITRKPAHRLIDSGPYALVRHPIYTGLIAAALVTAVAEETPQAVIGAALITLGLWGKATLEERFLRQEIGAALYDAYRRRVPMLIPFLPRSG